MGITSIPRKNRKVSYLLQRTYYQAYESYPQELNAVTRQYQIIHIDKHKRDSRR